MNRHLLSSAAMVFALSMFALPTGAAAQGRRNGNNGGQSRGSATPRSDAGRRASSGQARSSQGQARGSQGQARGNNNSGQQRGQVQAQRREAPRVENRGSAIQRSAPRIVGQRGSGIYRDSRPSYRSSSRFSRPYYTFRPRVRVGFNLWVGYPVVYPSYDPYYYDPYAYGPYPYDPYGYDPYDTYPAAPPSAYPDGGYPPQQQGSVNITPNATGGVSFEITPSDATVYVDGNYVGTASQFTPSQPPLSLQPGRHHVEIRAQGYDTISFDTDVTAGQVIPYQGDMSRR